MYSPPFARLRRVLAGTVSLLLGTFVGCAAVWTEEFASDPSARGWRSFGDSSLFSWNAAAQNLDVTWDSSRPNSFFFRRLEAVLGKNDDFALQFDLRLGSIQGGVNPEKPSTFEIAAGFLHLASATNADFNRGTGRDSPNLVEWTYFPAADIIDATVSPVIVSSNNQFAPGFNFPLEMATQELFHVALAYTASNQTLVTTMTRNGAPFGPIQNVQLPAAFTDFRVDAVSVHSYNEDAYGSILARGSIDNLSVTTPPPPIANLTGRVTNGLYRLQFTGRTNWSYTLERSEDWHGFIPVQTVPAAVSTNLLFDDPLALVARSRVYRVRADRP